MHDKFIVSYRDGREEAVLMGSTNFTPEAQTIKANLLHILHSRQLTGLYAERAHILAANKPTREITKLAGWHEITDITGSKVRDFFLPEQSSRRDFLDTVTEAVRRRDPPYYSACSQLPIRP